MKVRFRVMTHEKHPWNIFAYIDTWIKSVGYYFLNFGFGYYSDTQNILVIQIMYFFSIQIIYTPKT